jgi:hypothetical protein
MLMWRLRRLSAAAGFIVRKGKAPLMRGLFVGDCILVGLPAGLRLPYGFRWLRSRDSPFDSAQGRRGGCLHMSCDAGQI